MLSQTDFSDQGSILMEVPFVLQQFRKDWKIKGMEMSRFGVPVMAAMSSALVNTAALH